MANKYWVTGGNGNVSSTTNWSDTSGGASGAVKPGPGDAVIVNSSSGVGAITVDEATTWNSLSYSGRASYVAELFLAANLTINTAYALAGNNTGTQRAYVRSSVRGTPRTITVNGTIAHSNVDYEDIVFAGSASSAGGTSIGDCGGNTNINPSAPRNVYWFSASNQDPLNTAPWFAATNGGGGAAAPPLVQDTIIVDANSGSGDLDVAGTIGSGTLTRLGNINLTGALVSFQVVVGNRLLAIYGSVIQPAQRFSVSSSAAVYFKGRGNHTIQSTGTNWNGTGGSANFDSITGTHTLIDPFSATGTGGTVISSGTVLSAFNVTTLKVTISAGATFTQSAGVLELTGTGTIASVSATATVTTTNAVIKLTDASATAKTFSGGGKSYGEIWFSGVGTGTYDLVGNNSFSFIRADANRSIRFTAGSTTSFADYSIGTGATIGSITAANHTLVKTGGGIVTLLGATISRSTVSPTGSFRASGGSVDAGNNTVPGWYFGEYVATSIPTGTVEAEGTGLLGSVIITTPVAQGTMDLIDPSVILGSVSIPTSVSGYVVMSVGFSFEGVKVVSMPSGRDTNA